ncbi:MAG: DUF4340 domain-containing protein [Candidatus Methylomirabilales bacterium]
MRFRTTLFLAFALALLSLAYYLLELKGAQEKAKAKLVSFEEQEVTGLRIRRREKAITLSKGGRGWRMSQPVEDWGDEQEIAALLGNLTRAKIERTLNAKGGNLADFGLQEPPIILTVHLKDKERPLVLEVGNTNPAGFSVYARRKGEEEILLAPATLKTSLEKEPFAFRSKVPLLFEQDAVKAVSLHTGPLRLRLERQEKGGWRITEPIQVKADSGKVADLLRSLTQDQVKAFLDKPPKNLKSLGLDPPRGAIRLTLEDRAEATLLLGQVQKREGGVYARRKGEERVLVLREEFDKELPKRVANLRDRTLLALDRGKVEQIEIESPKGRTLLSKVEGTWRMKEPEEALADQRLVEDLLWDLSGARVKEFVTDQAKSLKPYGLQDPSVTIRLLGKEGRPVTSLALNRAEKREGAYVRVADGQAVYLVEARLYEQLEKGPFDLRFRQVLSFETWEVGRVELVRDGTTILLEKRRDRWQLRKPKEAPAKYSAVADLLRETRKLKWQKLIAKAPADLDRYGLNKPAVTLTLTKADGKSIGTLLLGKAEGDLVYAKMQERPEIYAVPLTFLKSLPKDPSPLLE